MGANAQTSVPTFTAGEVLTAANMNISARTGVPVFADSTARDAAFGGTGEKTLAEGQLCYLESTNVVQYYDGSVWATVGPSSAAGLVYLTGATFTTATSFSLPDNTFTSTYTNYRLHIVVTAVTSDADFTMRMRASGSDNTTTNYEYGYVQTDSSSATVSGITANSQTSFNLAEQDNAVIRYRVELDVLTPQLAQPTAIFGSLSYVNKAASSTFFRQLGGVHVGTSSFDSLSFISSVASSITGSYRVYGYATA